MISVDALRNTAIEYVEQIRKDTSHLEDDIREDKTSDIHTKIQMLNADINKLCAIIGIIETENDRHKKR